MNARSLSLLALACAAATTAQAQSSVTVYGVVDAGLLHITGVGANRASQNAVASGALWTPRLGFRGSEDLGNGMKANFLLESEILPDTGAQAGVFFKRGAWVGLSAAALGELRFGRQNVEGYDYIARFDPLRGANLGGAIGMTSGGVPANSGNSYNAYGLDRVDNAVQLRSASFAGFSGRYTHAFGEVAGAAAAGGLDSGGLEYNSTTLSAAANLYSRRSATAGVGSDNKGWGIYAAYNFGVFELSTGHTENKGQLAAGSKYKDTFFGGRWNVTPAITLAVQASFLKVEALDAKPRAYAMAATYAFSKRTSAYFIGARSDQDKGSLLNITSGSKIAGSQNTVAGTNQTGLALGIAHAF